jgi:hypothetical protein
MALPRLKEIDVFVNQGHNQRRNQTDTKTHEKGRLVIELQHVFAKAIIDKNRNEQRVDKTGQGLINESSGSLIVLGENLTGAVENEAIAFPKKQGIQKTGSHPMRDFFSVFQKKHIAVSNQRDKQAEQRNANQPCFCVMQNYLFHKCLIFLKGTNFFRP